MLCVFRHADFKYVVTFLVNRTFQNIYKYLFFVNSRECEDDLHTGVISVQKGRMSVVDQYKLLRMKVPRPHQKLITAFLIFYNYVHKPKTFAF